MKDWKSAWIDKSLQMVAKRDFYGQKLTWFCADRLEPVSRPYTTAIERLDIATDETQS